MVDKFYNVISFGVPEQGNQSDVQELTTQQDNVVFAIRRIELPTSGLIRENVGIELLKSQVWFSSIPTLGLFVEVCGASHEREDYQLVWGFILSTVNIRDFFPFNLGAITSLEWERAIERAVQDPRTIAYKKHKTATHGESFCNAVTPVVESDAIAIDHDEELTIDHQTVRGDGRLIGVGQLYVMTWIRNIARSRVNGSCLTGANFACSPEGSANPNQFTNSLIQYGANLRLWYRFIRIPQKDFNDLLIEQSSGLSTFP